MRGYLIPFCCLLVVLVLSGCNWFGKGLLNVINPEAEVRMYYVFNTPPDIGGPEKFELLQGLTFDLVVYPLNEVGFTIERLTYTTEKGEVAELAKDLVLSYYVPPTSLLSPPFLNLGRPAPMFSRTSRSFSRTPSIASGRTME